MKRAFLSLYLLIVLATLGLGWALDQWWSSYRQAEAQPSPGENLALTLALAAEDRSEAEFRALLERFNERSRARARLLPLEEIAGERLKPRLEEGVSVTDAEGNLYHYRRLAGTDRVLVVNPPTPATNRQLEAILTAVFYAALAAVVLFWLWPLARDLKRLEVWAHQLGENPETPRLRFGGHSAARQLGRAFERMAGRIRDLLRAQREMTHAVSHELRTPLARMKFALEMAESRPDRDSLARQIESLKADVGEMDELVNQLLNYARFEQRPALHRTAGDIAGLLDDLWRRLTRHRPSAPVFRVRSEALERPLVCDWILMERVLHNLLQNALRHAHSRIEVSLATRGGDFVLTVEDDGPGIPEAERERVFESFVRLHAQSQARGPGFGLGLAIVRRVLDWHDGRVSADVSPLGGARFTLQWPESPAP